MAGNRKKLFIIAASVVGVLAILCIWVVPRLVDVNRYRPQVAALLEQETGKPASIGHLDLTIFPHLAIQVDNFTLGNPSGFPPGDFLSARRIYAVLDAGALVIEGPVIHLLSGPDGHWNFENPSKGAPPAATPSKSKPASFSLEKISQITLDGGVVTVANLLPSGQAGPTYFEGQSISCRFEDVNVGAATASAAPSAMINRVKPGLLGALGSPTIAYAEGNSPQPIAHGSFRAGSLRFGAIQASSVNSQFRLQ
ncbi:MAG: hypothetical protein M1423_05165, partial [Acidobacteria bacterium]|nr:hypothetical protein [Acidobacteriota bacterium]